MRDNSPVASMVFETDQATESRRQWVLGAHMSVLLHSLRCQEAQTQNLPGQDYARVVARVSPGGGARLCFCVCDGVGSSYSGGFGARYLGIHVADWLFALDAIPANAQGLERSLSAELAQWSRTAQQELLAAGRPRVGSALEREVLEELRDQYGSEAVFLAGRIDVEGSFLASGVSSQARILLCWMGNVWAYLRSGGQRSQVFGALDDDRARWSSARGIRGALSVRILTTAAPWRLVVHTDGLAPLGDAILAMSDADLRREEQRLLGLPASDDMTLLALGWLVGKDQQRGGARESERDAAGE